MDDVVYVLIMVQDSSNRKESLFTMEPIGVYEDLHDALDYVDKLEEMSNDKENHYDVLEFKIGEKPFFLEYLEKEQKILEETVMKAILELMREGYVDQLIGEDGNFYYKLTEEGKELKMNMPKQIKKFFRRQGDEE